MDTPVFFTGVTLQGIHGHQEVQQPLSDGLNLLFGKNGTGKTTFLHVLANLLERDIERFCHVKFDMIEVITSRGTEIRLRQFGKGPSTSVEVFIDRKTLGTVQRDGVHSEELDVALKDRLGGRPVYLPAFRSILEATPTSRQPLSAPEREENEKEIRRIVKRESVHDNPGRVYRAQPGYFYRDRAETTAQKTLLCRRWFGNFVPVIRYPSLGDIHFELLSELQQAHFDINRTDQGIFSRVFVKVIESIVRDREPVPGGEAGGESSVEDSMKQVQGYLTALSSVLPKQPDVYAELARLFDEIKSESEHAEASLFAKVLRVYEQALAERKQVQEEAYRTIKRFQQSVNKFLQEKKSSSEEKSEPLHGKSLELNFGPTSSHMDLEPRIKLANGELARLSVLSSGERHVLSLLFSATHMRSMDGIVLIDEPELSLHVDWQRIILSELLNQVGNRQVIACTHSPEVVGDHFTRLRQLTARPWRTRAGTALPDSGEDDSDPIEESDR